MPLVGSRGRALAFLPFTLARACVMLHLHTWGSWHG